ncbi:unnamed protein product, partial [marine sediment metagenome]
MIRKFRKRPVVIEAVQWSGGNQNEVLTFCKDIKAWGEGGSVIIPTLEGNHTANKGDWIIKGVKGEFYPCKPDIFEQTYEEVK